jgi:phage gp29-like protein
LENYLLYSDRYAAPTAVGTVPATAIKEEVDAFYEHISNLASEMAVVLPPGFALDFVNPTSSPQLFIDFVDHIIKTINMLIISENEVGVAEAGSRASSEVANTVRVTRASELAQRISWDIQRSLVRWIVDLNFGEDVFCPRVERTFDILSSNLTVQDLSSLKENFGWVPSKTWVEKQFSVELEDVPEESEEDLSSMFG